MAGTWTAAAGTEAHAMQEILDALPIYAVKIGYRSESTIEERKLGEDLFTLHERWLELKAARESEEE